MKKVLNIVVMISMLLSNVLPFYITNVYAVNKTTTKLNESSYWSTKNAPMFYGATKITVKKGMLDKFNVLDARFRIFARDFEDGDLTDKITSTNNVKINEIGSYYIDYKVVDSHKNVSSIRVPVIVTDDDNVKINVERTLYTIPSVWNMDLAGFSKSNYSDRQILGIYLPANTSVKARVVSGKSDVIVDYITNDVAKDGKTVISKNGTWVTLQNKNSSVPFFKSEILSKKSIDLDEKYIVELEYDKYTQELDYYHYKDNEGIYLNKWKNNKNDYSVIENETISVVVPYKDINDIIRRRGIDAFLRYYKRVIDKMDEYVGLEFNPTNITDQNVRTKYLFRATTQDSSAVSYNTNYIKSVDNSVFAFFRENVDVLRALANGYIGNFDRDDAITDIILYYIQYDKLLSYAVATNSKTLLQLEDSKNSQRLVGTEYSLMDNGAKLYMLANLFNHFDSAMTYAKILSWYRQNISNNINFDNRTSQDLYVLAIADKYNVNVIPYIEAWNLGLSKEVKDKINSKYYPVHTILKDMVTSESLSTIMNGEAIRLKYGLVDNSVYQKYSNTGSLTLNISNDDLKKVRGKELFIKDGNTIIRRVNINNNIIEIANLPVGGYYLQAPSLDGNDYSNEIVLIKEDINTEYDYKNIIINTLPLEITVGINSGMNENDRYQIIKNNIISIIDAYNKKVTVEELNNKKVNSKEKEKIILYYNLLKEEDKLKYKDLITKIKQGGFPIITYIGSSQYVVGKVPSIGSLIKVYDNEDGNIKVTNDNTKYTTSSSSFNKPGNYYITYYVTDSDGNTTNHKVTIKVVDKNYSSGTSKPSGSTGSSGGSSSTGGSGSTSKPSGSTGSSGGSSTGGSGSTSKPGGSTGSSGGSSTGGSGSTSKPSGSTGSSGSSSTGGSGSTSKPGGSTGSSGGSSSTGGSGSTSKPGGSTGSSGGSSTGGSGSTSKPSGSTGSSGGSSSTGGSGSTSKPSGSTGSSGGSSSTGGSGSTSKPGGSTGSSGGSSSTGGSGSTSKPGGSTGSSGGSSTGGSGSTSKPGGSTGSSGGSSSTGGSGSTSKPGGSTGSSGGSSTGGSGSSNTSKPSASTGSSTNPGNPNNSSTINNSDITNNNDNETTNDANITTVEVPNTYAHTPFYMYIIGILVFLSGLFLINIARKRIE